MGNRKPRRNGLGFQKFINESGLIDLGFGSQKFAWFSCRESKAIKERSDRGFDHYPILVETNARDKRKSRSFKFGIFWGEKEDCERVIRD